MHISTANILEMVRGMTNITMDIKQEVLLGFDYSI